MTENKYLEIAKDIENRYLKCDGEGLPVYVKCNCLIHMITEALESVARERDSEAWQLKKEIEERSWERVKSLEKQLSEKEAELEILRKDNVLGPWRLIDGLKKDREKAVGYLKRIKELEFIINSDLPSVTMLLNSGKKIASLEAEVARWQKEFGIAGRKVTTLSQKLEQSEKGGEVK